MSDDKLREKIAAYCHSQWSGWIRYLFEKCADNNDGTVTMPTWAVERWKRQMKTPYAELSEQEKDNDRKEADGFLKAYIEGRYVFPVEEKCLT